MVADRYGAGRVLVVGVLLIALGTALTPFMTTTLGLMFAMRSSAMLLRDHTV